MITACFVYSCSLAPHTWGFICEWWIRWSGNVLEHGVSIYLLDHLQTRDQCKNNIFLQSSCIIPRKNFLICKDLAIKSSGFDCQLSLTYRYSWYLRYQCLKYPCSTVCVLLYSLDREVGSMEEAHEGMVWSLAWHPMGHILATGSNDHST